MIKFVLFLTVSNAQVAIPCNGIRALKSAWGKTTIYYHIDESTHHMATVNGDVNTVLRQIKEACK